MLLPLLLVMMSIRGFAATYDDISFTADIAFDSLSAASSDSLFTITATVVMDDAWADSLVAINLYTGIGRESTRYTCFVRQNNTPPVFMEKTGDAYTMQVRAIPLSVTAPINLTLELEGGVFSSFLQREEKLPVYELPMQTRTYSLRTLSTDFETKSQAATDISEEGLIAYYPLNGNASDESGQGNNGTVHGAVFTTDFCGNTNAACQFNGSTDYIDCGNLPVLNQAFTAFSVSAWIYPMSGGESVQGFVSKWNNTKQEDHFALYLYNNKALWAVANPSYSCNGVQSPGTVGVNGWHHVVGTWDNTGEHNIYIDGLLVTTALSNTFNWINTASDVSLKLGAQTYPSGNYRPYKGKLDEVRIYRRKLTSQEIQSLYNQYSQAVEGIQVQQVSSYNNTTNILWRVLNPNPQAVPVHWSSPGGQQGTVLLPPAGEAGVRWIGDLGEANYTFIRVPVEPGQNSITLEYGCNQSLTVQAGTYNLSPLRLEQVCTIDPLKDRAWRVMNANTREVEVTYTVEGDRKDTLILPPSGQALEEYELAGGSLDFSYILISGLSGNATMNMNYGNNALVSATSLGIACLELADGYAGREDVTLKEPIRSEKLKKASNFMFMLLDSTSIPLQTITSPKGRIRMEDFNTDEVSITHNTPYSVKVNVLYEGVWLGYGQEISFTTIAMPTTHLMEDYCNIVNVELATLLFVEKIAKAEEYEFRLRDEEGNVAYFRTQKNKCKLYNFQDAIVLTFNREYTMAVRYLKNKEWSGFGKACTLKTTEEGLLNDYKEFALTLEINKCSEAAALYNNNATADGVKPACWDKNMPRNNVWYKFTATGSTVKIILNTGDVTGTLAMPYLALFDDLGNELACSKFSPGSNNTAELTATTLVPGKIYYIMTDNKGGADNQGTFTLCLTDNQEGNIFYSISDGLWTQPIWSKNRRNPTDEKPGPNDIVYIEGHHVQVSGNAFARIVYVIGTKLGFVEGGKLRAGKVEVKN